ncbi:nicotinate (nicotinamide) nucleotide adenylyltransferase [Coxiella endosymbiont of Amblyomma americanum]|uniref:nicotinate (nicotinamide) nucleotide adenylyltransferase n=1 Tax=Coxiella endosymbiont of Amblyomma americanum TaxID=325775 RepID=UPI00057E227B|nr:nicotinate (nicotinamide) nucleotide adenylyltransferase [Coxiella endosymbiont of Amblyomma americanum]AJC50638.1 nicotinate-nucleotide adenylyltransferase [Coxiella endosymbiont of Amblyomma americanum]AUJ58967.1 nicotinate-nicotinamide nucleotide adenylyltransferase [Coxiella-like endosymbiont of Amblyomma americanum]
MSFPLLGLFGGRFDPIHNGHLSVLSQLIEKLPFEIIQLIPCYQSSHQKRLMANSLDRLEMIRLAIVDYSMLTVNDIEIERQGVSYTIYTLQFLRNLLPNYSLCFILSTDAFARFNLWYRYAEILNYCHLIVTNRTTYCLSMDTWLETLLQNQTIDPNDLKRFISGKIFFQQLSACPISATKIRDYLVQGNYTAIQSMLPKTVVEYIKRHNLYQ